MGLLRIGEGLFLASTLRVDGWLYLARPVLALGVVLFVVAVWAVDRRQSRRVRAASLETLVAPPRPTGDWWIEHEGRRLTPGDMLTIGRAPDCGLVLSDPAASALHAAITRGADGCLRLEDLGSRNGTLCQGSLVVAPTLLDVGHVVQIGDAIVRVGRDPA